MRGRKTICLVCGSVLADEEVLQHVEDDKGCGLALMLNLGQRKPRAPRGLETDSALHLVREHLILPLWRLDNWLLLRLGHGWQHSLALLSQFLQVRTLVRATQVPALAYFIHRAAASSVCLEHLT